MIKPDFFYPSGTLRNTVRNLYGVWTNHNWSKVDGWSPSIEWKKSFTDNVLYKVLKEGSNILEIGPGYGHWTGELILRAAEITLVDQVPKCIEACAERFSHHSNVTYHVNDGTNIDFIQRESIDFVFSMDCFIQIPPIVILKYLRQIYEVLRIGGVGLIHHAKNGERMTGWRSDMTDGKMARFCDACNLVVVDQLTSWENGKYEIWPNMDCDVVTIFKKIR